MSCSIDIVSLQFCSTDNDDKLLIPTRICQNCTQNETQVYIWCMHQKAGKCTALRDPRAWTAHAIWDT